MGSVRGNETNLSLRRKRGEGRDLSTRHNMKDLIIGGHVHFNKNDQLVVSVKQAIDYGANTFMFYTGAPQNTNRAVLDDNLINEAKQMMIDNNIDINDVIIHAPYIINLANNNDSYDFAISFLKEEINRAIKLGIKKIVLHPGSHVKLGESIGIENIIYALNKVLEPDKDIIICLETMAGKGSECGKTFSEIKQMIDGVILKDKIGVCLDTCHINDAGYDLNNFDAILDEFDKVIGLKYLKCVHINDSKNIIGSHKDRHENIGYGTIGFANMLKVIYHEKLKDIPKILETPFVTKTDDSKERLYAPYKQEIEMIKKKEFNPHLIEDVREYYK